MNYSFSEPTFKKIISIYSIQKPKYFNLILPNNHKAVNNNF